MPREKKGNPMNPSKRVANTPPISSKELAEEWQWQPQGPCKFLQLQRDLVMDILSRLPINTLFNCKCVCKAWISLISNPHFAHLCISRSPIGILIKAFPPKSISKKLDFTQIEECADSPWRLQKMRFTPKTSLPVPNSEFDLINSCNGLLCLSVPQGNEVSDGLFYVCNPILGEYITIPPADKGRAHYTSVALGFSARTNEYKVLRTFDPLSEPVTTDNYEAEIYTIGTGLWRSINGNISKGIGSQLPFNAYLNGALHWVSHGSNVSELINSFNFETEKFHPLPPPSYFGLIEKQFSDCLKLGVLGGCLLLCVFGNDSSKFVMWVMKDYAVQESWTKTLVIENLYDRELSCDLYEPMVFLSNGEIIMSYNDWIVVCYNRKRKSLRETRITYAREFHAIAYSPCFVSLYDVSKVEEVKRVRVQGSKKCDKLSTEGSYDCTDPGLPRDKSRKLNSGHACPAFKEDLPRAMNSSVTPDFRLEDWDSVRSMQ